MDTAKIKISREMARKFLLQYQGLGNSAQFTGKQGIVDYIKRVGCIQFDPLNIAGRNHELVLQSRIPRFSREMLEELLYTDRKLLDGWDKNMSIYSVEDWPYFKRFREGQKERLGHSSRPAAEILGEVRREFEERGPLSSGDIDYNQTVDWSWAPTRLSRAVLESMYFWGELVIHHKANTRKIYDLAVRHIPRALLESPDPNISDEQYYTWYVLRRIGSIGLLWNRPSDAWLGISGLKSSERNRAFKTLLESEKISEVSIEGTEAPLYVKNEYVPMLDSAGENILEKRAEIIAPLDNLLWDRKLIRELFGFEYSWEVYKPAAERKYGYYVLPVLYGDRFVARFEPGMDKKEGVLLIKNWWWEPEADAGDELKNAVSKCFHNFLDFLAAKEIAVDKKLQSREGLGFLNTFKSSKSHKTRSENT